MYVRHLNLTDFRSYPGADLPLQPGVSLLLGSNGQGKTNVLEAIGYVASLSSHRVSNDAPLVRQDTEQAVIRLAVVRDGRESLAELEINPGRANRARLNRSPLPRSRDLLGTVRSVLFSPEDLALVKGDPAERRRFLDELLVQRQPRWSAVRADYDKALRQRNALLKATGGSWRRPGAGRFVGGEDPPGQDPTSLAVWDEQVAGIGAQLLYARLRLLRDLRPLLSTTYAQVSAENAGVDADYRSSLAPQAAESISAGEVPTPEQLRIALLEAFDQTRTREIERGFSLVGPHRDEVELRLSGLPARGYASHGESWSLALALRVASFQLLRHDLGDDPVLLLDDVFAELDQGRRTRLADIVADCEQVLITAAVAEDVPNQLAGETFWVTRGQIRTNADQESPQGDSPRGQQDVLVPDGHPVGGLADPVLLDQRPRDGELVETEPGRQEPCDG